MHHFDVNCGIPTALTSYGTISPPLPLATFTFFGPLQFDYALLIPSKSNTFQFWSHFRFSLLQSSSCMLLKKYVLLYSLHGDSKKASYPAPRHKFYSVLNYLFHPTASNMMVALLGSYSNSCWVAQFLQAFNATLECHQLIVSKSLHVHLCRLVCSDLTHYVKPILFIMGPSIRGGFTYCVCCRRA